MQETTPSNQNTRTERPALWALFGVITGFTLPVFTCIALFLVLSITLGAVGSGSSLAGTTLASTHVSGPLTGPAIALIEINGEITSGRAGPFDTGTVAASETIIQQIQAAKNDPDVRALLLKVNSPGGSVVGSDEIYQALKQSKLPVVVAMGEIAASGGYYISMAGEYIFANPNSLVGSVGVISTIPNAEELLGKVGLEFNVFTSGDSKDFGSLYRDITPEEEAYWQSVIDETYANFVQVVVEGRKLSTEEVMNFADGRVYTARQALEYKMIDQLGYLKDAIEKAGALGAIPGEPRVIRYDTPATLASFLQFAFSPKTPTISTETVKDYLQPSLEYRWVP